MAAAESEEKADNLFKNLVEKYHDLSRFPERGHAPHEANTFPIGNLKEVHYKQFRIIYEVEVRNVYVYGIVDGRRNTQEILKRRLLK